MTNTDQPTLAETLTTIDTVALDAVTGGCAACGQDCANGAVPIAQDPRRDLFGGAAGQAGQ